MVKQQFPAMDAWMWEAGEASRLIDELEIKINNRTSDHLLRLKDSAKPKLLELGVKLDRLESLLLNPPSKPILTEMDIDTRWKLLSDIQLRTRAVALTLFASNRHEDLKSSADTKETTRSAGIHNQAHDAGHAASSLPEYDPELLRPLVQVDVIPSYKQMDECSSSTGRKTWLQKACCAIIGILGSFALLFGLFVVCSLL